MMAVDRMAARARDNMITVTIRLTVIIAITRYLFFRHPYSGKGSRRASDADMPAGLSNGPVTENEPLYDGSKPVNCPNPHKVSASSKNEKRVNNNFSSFNRDQIA